MISLHLHDLIGKMVIMLTTSEGLSIHLFHKYSKCLYVLGIVLDAENAAMNKTVKNPCPHGVHYVRRKQTREQINKIQKICMFNGELWRKVKQKSGLENRWKGSNLYREVREDLAGVTFDERSEEGHRAGAGGRETTRCKS